MRKLSAIRRSNEPLWVKQWVETRHAQEGTEVQSDEIDIQQVDPDILKEVRR